MNVLSLFDGMSCGQIALKELCAPVNKYYASEVDKHAIKQTQLNFPGTIQLGKVEDVDARKLDKIDLLLGGSPCQSFSFAGRRNGMTTTDNEEIYTLERYLELKDKGFEFEGESYLFWEYMRVLTDIRKYNNPDVYFLLENVEMGKKWERVLSEAVGLFGVHINSSLVSAQVRKRIYWTNIRTRQEGLFGEIHSDIPQPEDRGILLKDILEDEVGEKYFLSDRIIKSLSDKPEGWNTFEVYKRFDLKAKPINARLSKMGAQDNYVSVDGKTYTGDHLGICVAMRGRNTDNPSSRKTGIATEQRFEPNVSGKTNCLTSVAKDNLVMQLNTSTESGGKQPYQQNRVYDSNFKSPAHMAQISNNSYAIRDNHYRIRRLTPTECSRLQTVPVWYIWKCSDTQQYKMLGNGWTVKVIEHILSFFPYPAEILTTPSLHGRG